MVWLVGLLTIIIGEMVRSPNGGGEAGGGFIFARSWLWFLQMILYFKGFSKRCSKMEQLRCSIIDQSNVPKWNRSDKRERGN